MLISKNNIINESDNIEVIKIRFNKKTAKFKGKSLIKPILNKFQFFIWSFKGSFIITKARLMLNKL